MSEDDGPLLLSHGDVLGVIVPGIAEGIELSLELLGDGRDDGVVGVKKEVLGAEESVGFGPEEIVDFSPDLGSDVGFVGHCKVIRREREVFMRECKAEVGWKLRVLCGEVTHVTPRVAVCDLGGVTCDL